MKAEHRKELQTNTLADWLGRTVRGARGGTGVSWPKLGLALVVVLGVVIFFWIKGNIARNNVELWVKLQNNTQKQLGELEKENKETNQGKAASMTLAFSFLYEGVRFLGAPGQMENADAFLRESYNRFTLLEGECKDEPEWQAEAKYGKAVATESFAVKEPKALDEAKKLYEELGKGSLGQTPFGILAKRRFEQLNDPVQYAAIATFYREFKSRSIKSHPQ